MGVGSNRVDVKQAAARAERALERLAEPLSALFLPAESWPATFVDLAWTLIIRNAAHDSICACSVDDVVDAVLHRYAEARHIGEGLTERGAWRHSVGPWPNPGRWWSTRRPATGAGWSRSWCRRTDRPAPTSR